MTQNKNDDTVADYSSYFKKTGSVIEKTATPESPIQEIAAARKFNKRAFTLFLVLIALVIAQGVLLYIWNKNTMPPVPEGYQLVTPKNQPAYIQPN